MSIPLPTTFKITKDSINPYKATVEVSPLYPGYGHTIGNTLRRVLLSSLEGAGITSVKIENAEHEFMTLPYIKEEVLEIILNLKQLNITLHGDEKQKIELSAKGKMHVKAKDFKKNANVEIANQDQIIATLTDKSAHLNIEATVEKGLGYSPLEEREKESEVGVMAIDTIFSPIKSVGYLVEDTRVGKRTDYDKLIMNIETNGTIEVGHAINKATEILIKQFSFIFDETENNTEEKKGKVKKAKKSKK